MNAKIIQRKIDVRSARLKKMIKLEAPNFMIEIEKKLLQEALEIMAEINEDMISKHVVASLCELRESTWTGIEQSKNKVDKGKISLETFDLTLTMGTNLIDIIDEYIQAENERAKAMFKTLKAKGGLTVDGSERVMLFRVK